MRAANAGGSFSTDVNVSFEEFKSKLNKVDKKYSLSYNEPELDMPESLNLEKLSFIEKSEAWYTERAFEMTQASFIRKKYVIDKREAELCEKINFEIDAVDAAAEEEKVKLEKELTESRSKIKADAVKRGTYRSDTTDRAVRALADSFNKLEEEIVLKQEAKKAVLADRIIKLSERTAQAVASLLSEREAEMKDDITELKQDAEKEQTDILKYNNGIDERELKYRANRAKAYESARMAEAQRALKASEIYAQLGSSGMEEQLANEKLSLGKQYFALLPKAEALSLLESDGSMRGHFGKYYDYLIDYVSTLS